MDLGFSLVLVALSLRVVKKRKEARKSTSQSIFCDVQEGRRKGSEISDERGETDPSLNRRVCCGGIYS